MSVEGLDNVNPIDELRDELNSVGIDHGDLYPEDVELYKKYKRGELDLGEVMSRGAVLRAITPTQGQVVLIEFLTDKLKG